MISSFLRNTSSNPTSAAPVSFAFSFMGAISLLTLVILAAAVVPHGELFKLSNHPSPECCVVVDCGFSFTHVIPILENKVIWKAVKRCGPCFLSTYPGFLVTHMPFMPGLTSVENS